MMTVIAFLAGLIVGWNFLVQPQWVKDKVDAVFSAIRAKLKL